MGWQMAVAGALGAAQYQQQGAIGKYNQAANERTGQVLDNQAIQIEQKAEFDVAQFGKTYEKVKGETRVALAKSGVQVGTGSAYNIALSNAIEKKLQENLIYYNSRVAAANKREEANFARIKGQIARQESKLAQLKTVASTGSSLITMNKGTG
jgi:hypothetical protein